jgi:hypothetical protein
MWWEKTGLSKARKNQDRQFQNVTRQRLSKTARLAVAKQRAQRVAAADLARQTDIRKTSHEGINNHDA